MRSISQRLLICLTLLLLLFFGVMIAVLEARFRATAERAQRELLEGQMLALVQSVDIGEDGQVTSDLADSEARLAVPGSGLYAAIRAGSHLLWRSPSSAGHVTDFGPQLEPGENAFHELVGLGGQRLAALSRGRLWEDVGRLTLTVATDTSTYDAELKMFRRGLQGGFAVVAALLLLALAGLLRWMLAPLRRLASQIREVEQGERDQLGNSWPTELTGVVANLNTLLAAERTRIARYRDTLGNLAHSLKTPLAVLRASFPPGAPGAAQVNQQVERMTAIVEHQLRKAATSGGASVGRHAVPLLPIAQDLRGAMLKAHGRKDFSLEVAVPESLLFVGDKDDLTEALGNLMDNAAKWCRSQVRVSAVLDPQAGASQKLRIVVEDDGPGIAAEDRARVIERGARADEHTPGHGLGLAMVRDMADVYGGRLELSASALGGARIELALPGRQR
jgi:two-component system sensor histidine kinase PhoQ